MTSLSAGLLYELEREAPKRATRVVSRLPAWLTAALNAGYELEILNHFGRRLKNIGDAGEFLRHLERECSCHPFDHCGSDADGNFISEPYGLRCPRCRIFAARFAERLGVELTVGMTTCHAPGSETSIRFVFHKPKVAR